jgi:uncharacterized protein YecE (DUF72 family)
MASAIHIGTSGWSYKHWRDRFYPEKTAPRDYLAFYARHFHTTEVNTSFYHLPKPETIKHWVSVVEKTFLFCPKISRYITHIKKLNDPEETLPKFFDLFEPIKKHLGPILIQLPPSLSFDAERATEFYRALKKYKGYHFALEARHESWFVKESITLLKKQGIAFVIAESGNRRPYIEVVTDQNIYLRLHGPSGYDSSYPDKILRTFARKVADWKKEGHTVWIFFNNDGKAHAVFNAQKLIEMTERIP